MRERDTYIVRIFSMACAITTPTKKKKKTFFLSTRICTRICTFPKVKYIFIHYTHTHRGIPNDSISIHRARAYLFIVTVAPHTLKYNIYIYTRIRESKLNCYRAYIYSAIHVYAISKKYIKYKSQKYFKIFKY